MPTNNPHVIESVTENWMKDDFYESALVLGLDIGIEGIGVWLRKGREPLFARTFMVSLPEAAPLKNRRAKRAQRHARQSLRRREAMLREWVVRYGLLPREKLTDSWWKNPAVFERAFEHRHRAITTGVASPECLVVCIRHLVRHRGFDYHLTDEGAFPWGDELDDKEIIQWAKNSCCAPEYRTHLCNLIEADAAWAKNSDGSFTEKYLKVRQALDDAVREYENRPVERMLEQHMSEKSHPHLRPRARGHNFARELVKQHLYAICEKHRHFFAPGTFDRAMRELLGDPAGAGQWKLTWMDQDGKPQQTILDYHRRTREEAEELWKRKVKKCPFAPLLFEKGLLTTPQHECAVRGDPRIRRFNLLMFLAERRIELETHDAEGRLQNPRVNLDANVVRELLGDMEQDIQAVEALRSKQSASRPDKPGKKTFEKRFHLSLAGVGKGSFNADFFDQLSDLLRPELRSLKGRASLSGEAAEALFNLATRNGTDFEPARIRQALEDCGYYDWRANPPAGLGIYPQVTFLLGARGHYDQVGNPKQIDRRTGKPVHHGILRRLFAGQLRVDDGTGHGAQLVDLSEHLAGKSVPDYVIIETIGDIPKNQKEKKEFKDKIKANRSRKTDIIEKKYGLKLDSLSDWQVKQVLLFDQQANEEGEAFSPYTGASLGKNPLAHDLEVEHIYPERRGGISVMDNLVITWRTENQTKGDRTPWEWAKDEGWRVDAHLQRMHWNANKRALFVRQESDPPQWDNTTRMAQLARHLRAEVIHWLGLDQIQDQKERNKEIARRIGTPTGFQTGICRESWTPYTVFPQMYRQLFDKKGIPVRDKNGQERWVKDRTNLRHHLWDAAVLSHIPPGVGLNSADCGGIFVHRRDPQTGAWSVSALPGLGPDLVAFERANANRCLVVRLRQRKSKKSRYKETIFSLPDQQNRLFARELLSKYSAKKTDTELRKLLDRPGLLQPLEINDKKTGRVRRIQLLREEDVKRWLSCKDISLNPQEFRDFLTNLGVPPERIGNEAVAEQFKNKQTGETRARREFKAAQLIAFIRKKCGIKDNEIPDVRVEDAILARMERAVLRAANGRDERPGQVIRSIPIEQDKLPECGFGLHFNPTARPKHGNEVAGFKAVDNSNSVVYLRREIWIGQRIKKKGRKTTEETFYESRLIPHPRHLASYQKLHGRPWKADPLPDGMTRAGTLAVGDVLRVPLKREKRNRNDNLIAKRGETPLEWRFYRVKSLKTDRTVEFQMAEFAEPKLAKGQIPDPATKRLLETYELTCSNDADLLWLLEVTTGNTIEPPPPVVETPPNTEKREGELL